MSKHTVTLSEEGLNRIQQIFKKLSGEKLEKIKQQAITELSRMTLEEVNKNALSMVKGEGIDASKDNKLEIKENGFRVYNDNPKAVFAEYGTGIVGSNSPHPYLEGWIYDVNNHGERGWWFPTEDPRYIKKYTKAGRGIGFTRGEPSQPFYYISRRRILEESKPVISKIIEKEISTI